MHLRSLNNLAGASALAIMMMFLLAPSAAADTIWWTGAVAEGAEGYKQWENTGNWATTQGGTLPAGPPGSDADVIFGGSAQNTVGITLTADRRFATLTHAGYFDYSIVYNSVARLWTNSEFAITMTGEGGNANLTIPEFRSNWGGTVAGQRLTTKFTNNGQGTLDVASLWYQGSDPAGGAEQREFVFHVADAFGLIKVGKLVKRNGLNKIDVVKTGAGTLQLSGSETSFYVDGTGVSGLTGKVTINGGTLRITSGLEDSLGRYNALTGDFAHDVLTLDGGTLRVSTMSLTLDDYNRGITLGENGGSFQVDSGLTLSIGDDNVITGTGGLTKLGTGTLRLAAENTYTGLTTVEAGPLHVTGSLAANGSADVRVASAGSAFSGATDPSIRRMVGSGGSFAGLGSQAFGSGTLATKTDIRAGVNTSGAAVEMDMAWRTFGSADTDSFPALTNLLSDVLKLDGMDSDSDPFVLQMSYDAGLLASYHDPAFLAWLSSEGWTNAVDGNAGSGVAAVPQFAGSWDDFADVYDTTDLASYLGSWGVDAGNHVAWAVLNHNSQFAVMAVPEPGTLLLGCTGLLCLLAVQRRRR